VAEAKSTCRVYVPMPSGGLLRTWPFFPWSILLETRNMGVVSMLTRVPFESLLNNNTSVFVHVVMAYLGRLAYIGTEESVDHLELVMTRHSKVAKCVIASIDNYLTLINLYFLVFVHFPVLIVNLY
jgi:hypothetical protein